jgi:hypothetical protein
MDTHEMGPWECTTGTEWLESQCSCGVVWTWSRTGGMQQVTSFITTCPEPEPPQDDDDGLGHVCPMCADYGLVTPSEVGPEAEHAEISISCGESMGGVLCRHCREQGLHLAD